jgi:hypothetical protein
MHEKGLSRHEGRGTISALIDASNVGNIVAQKAIPMFGHFGKIGLP